MAAPNPEANAPAALFSRTRVSGSSNAVDSATPS